MSTPQRLELRKEHATAINPALAGSAPISTVNEHQRTERTDQTDAVMVAGSLMPPPNTPPHSQNAQTPAAADIPSLPCIPARTQPRPHPPSAADSLSPRGQHTSRSTRCDTSATGRQGGSESISPIALPNSGGRSHCCSDRPPSLPVIRGFTPFGSEQPPICNAS